MTGAIIRGTTVAGLLATAAIGLAACGSSGSPSHAGSPANSGPPTTSAQSATTTAGNDSSSSTATGAGNTSPMPGDACALITADQVASATGLTVKPEPVRVGPARCSYFAEGDSGSQVSLETSTLADAKSTLEDYRSMYKPVPGIGTEAYTNSDSTGVYLYINVGSWVLYLSGQFPDAKLDQLMTIGKAALSH
jgi:hypothetical protein